MDRADTFDTASSLETRRRPTKRTKVALIGGTLLVSMTVIVWLRPWEQQSEPLPPKTPIAKELFVLEETCTTVAVSPDGRILAFDHNEADISKAEVRLYDIERRQVNNKFLGWMGRGHQPGLAFSHDGSLLVTSGGTLVWDIRGEKELLKSAKSADLQGSIFAVHPSKNILAVAGKMTGDDYVRLTLLDPATGVRVIRLEWRDNPEFDLGRASCLAFSPETRLFTLLQAVGMICSFVDTVGREDLLNVDITKITEAESPASVEDAVAEIFSLLPPRRFEAQFRDVSGQHKALELTYAMAQVRQSQGGSSDSA